MDGLGQVHKTGLECKVYVHQDLVSFGSAEGNVVVLISDLARDVQTNMFLANT